jgi:hypothetical protein
MATSQHPIQFLYALSLASQKPDGRVDPRYRPMLIFGLMLTAVFRSLIGAAFVLLPGLQAWNETKYFGMEPAYLLAGALGFALVSGLDNRAATIRAQFGWLPHLDTLRRKSSVFVLTAGPAAVGLWFSFRQPLGTIVGFAAYFLLVAFLARHLAHRSVSSG